MIQIDIVLKIGDCEKQMPMDMARNLYFELGRLFDGGKQNYTENSMYNNVYHKNIDIPTPQPDLHPQVQEARENAAKKTGGCGGGCGGSKKKELKEKVEARKTGTTTTNK